MIITNLNELAHFLWQAYVKKGDTVLDATCGNGHDTLRLLELAGEEGIVYAVDIQPAAVEKCRSNTSNAKNAVYITDSHSNIDKYIKDNLSAAVFNLGYLPNSDHDIVTRQQTTLIAVEKAMKLLKKEGIISITAYLGHDQALEYTAVADFFKSLDPKRFKVVEIDPLNQSDLSPKLFICQKL